MTVLAPPQNLPTSVSFVLYNLNHVHSTEIQTSTYKRNTALCTILQDFRLLSCTYNVLFRTSSLAGGRSCTPPLILHCCDNCPAMANVVFTASTILPISSLPKKSVTFWGNTQLPFKIGYNSNFVYENAISGKLKNFHVKSEIYFSA